MSDMSEVRCVLGIDVSRDIEKGQLPISLGKYVRTVLERCGIFDFNATHLPGSRMELSVNKSAINSKLWLASCWKET